MVVNVLSAVLFIIFLSLGSIHFYWALGGKWGAKNAIPTKAASKTLSFKPSAFATFLVGLILIFLSSFYLIQTSFVSFFTLNGQTIFYGLFLLYF